MTSLHVTSAANVESSINSWFGQQLNTFFLPAYLPSFTIYYDWPEQELTFPSYSFTHQPVATRHRFQGNVENATTSAAESQALFEVNCWVNREQLYNGQEVWIPRLQQMAAMIEHIVTADPVVVINDYQTSPNFPVTTSYLVHFGDIQKPNVLPDENPAVRRRRLLIPYWWFLRAN